MAPSREKSFKSSGFLISNHGSQNQVAQYFPSAERTVNPEYYTW